MPEQTLSDGASRSVLNSSPAILGASAVLALIGLSRTSLWRRVRDGDFPAPVRLVGHASRAVGWRRVDVERWLEALAEGVGRRLERSGIGGDPIRRGVKRQRVGTTAIDSSLTERPRVLEPSSRRYPASAAEADAKRSACTVQAQPPWVRIGRGGEAASGLDLCGRLYPADNPPQPAQRVHLPKPGWRSGARSPCLP